PGETSVNFHQGADGKGATFTVLEVTNTAGQSFLVGGYNPQSWASDEGWHETQRDWQRTAFLFNMTSPAVYRQVLTDYVLPSQGLRQTYNEVGYGPIFGSGPDLFVNDELTAATSWQLSYGNPAHEGFSIVDGSLHGEIVKLDAMEVFAISPVPEPGNAAMLLAGICILGVTVRRRTL
ncbi:MAG: PEP_CTERM-anchored TLD domain-containing protein, partial [Massilia sp.]